MLLVGARGQERNDNLFDASGTITSGGTAQLLLPAAVSRSFLMIQNISDTLMYIKFGAARLTATLTSGAISSVTVNDGGFGFTTSENILPIIIPYGGGTDPRFYGNSFVGVGQPGYPAPVAGSNNSSTAHPAQLKPVMAAGAIASVTIEDGGAGYKTAPYLHVINSKFDPIGCATASAGAGSILLPVSGGAIATVPGSAALPLTWNGTMCPTDPISIFCATTGKAFTVLWAP